jgi:carbamate kinase
MRGIAVVAVGGNALTREDQEGTPEQIGANAARVAAGVPVCAGRLAGGRRAR